MLRFIVDENLSPALAGWLRRLKYNARAVREVGLKGKSDEEIISWLQKYDCIIITSDLDFGEFFYWKTLGNFGVIVLRSKSQSIVAYKQTLMRLHKQDVLKDKKLTGALLVVSETRLRWRKFK